ncbi:hypothetical protein Hsw_1387 [Hymenobacter swuensis DY53]|uniref:Uncharacterized protein n=1 Tax=Hymenobacter swuensis DY53 TaxID=1227739 RepID=W8EZ15_9BACT|nr:hypothetical protein Hsw_1387 [Hymenobacter swuensis DY53]
MAELFQYLKDGLRWLGDLLLDGLLADLFAWLSDWFSS